jgi:hypothetical protein
LFALVALVCSAPVQLRAQEASAAPVAPTPQETPPQPAWRTQVELGFNGSTGNSSFAVLRTGFTVTHLRTRTAEVEVSGLFNYGESEDRLIARNWRTTVKVDLVPEDRWSPFLFATTSSDALRRLDLRSEGGVGLKRTFWSGEGGEASLSVASLYSYEDFDQIQGAEPLSPQRSARWSFRARGERRIGGSQIKHTTFYQPLWDHSGDYLVNAVTTLTATLVGALALSVEHEYLHDSLPPPDVLRDEQKLSVVFRYTF